MKLLKFYEQTKYRILRYVPLALLRTNGLGENPFVVSDCKAIVSNHLEEIIFRLLFLSFSIVSYPVHAFFDYDRAIMAAKKELA